MGLFPPVIRYSGFSWVLLAASLTAAPVPPPTTSVSTGSGLTVSVSATGAYQVTVVSPAWQFSGDVGSPLLNLSAQSGADNVDGPYSEISFDFISGASRHAAIRAYSASRAVLFTVTVPSGAPNTFSFPSLATYPAGLHHIAFAGLFGYPTFYGSNSESPAVFFDSSYNTFILSPASHFMVASTGSSPAGQLASGISTQIQSLPAGFTHQTLLVVETGVNHAFDTWGTLLTRITGKTRPANDSDLTLNTLGYWTDAGSTYYYSMAPGLAYPDTLSAVKADFARQGFSLGYLQLDSWFYPKGAPGDWLSTQGGIYQYFAASPPFSTSLAAFQSNLGIPLLTHSRWIDPGSPYRQQYRMSGNVSTDPLYWAAVAGYLASSGAAAFEQDWLFSLASTDYNLTDADDFLGNMSTALSARNIAIQYCSATTRHFLQSAQYNNVTTIRVSPDRFDQTRWTSFLYASRLASAVGAWPFTDVFLSSETPNLLLATLSAGPIGVGDPIGAINAANLQHAVRPDGVIVKPDVPITPIDSTFWSDSTNALAPIVAASYTDFGGLRAWYLFLYPQSANTQAAFRLSDLGISRPVLLYDYFQGTASIVQPGDLLNEIVPSYQYLVAAPIGPSGIAVVGDAGNYVTLGKKRIASLTDDGAVHIKVVFAPGESARTLFGYSPGPIAIVAESGRVGHIDYDSATGQFRVEVTPAADASASLRIFPGSHKAPCPVGATCMPLPRK